MSPQQCHAKKAEREYQKKGQKQKKQKRKQQEKRTRFNKRKNTPRQTQGTPDPKRGRKDRTDPSINGKAIGCAKRSAQKVKVPLRRVRMGSQALRAQGSILRIGTSLSLSALPSQSTKKTSLCTYVISTQEVSDCVRAPLSFGKNRRAGQTPRPTYAKGSHSSYRGSDTA